MSNVVLDIESIPNPEGYEAYLKDATENFKAPSSLTKTKACADLGIIGNDAKYTSKDDAIAKWEAKFSEEKAPGVADENHSKESFNGAKGQICSIAWAIGDGKVESRSRKSLTEVGILKQFFHCLKEDLKGRPPFFIGHYIAGFDLKFIFHRAVILGVKPPFDLPFNGRHGQHFFDNMIAWAGHKDRISQDDLCKALGIDGKPDDIDGSKVWAYYKEGRIEEIETYNRDDVDKARQIYNRINFI